MRTDAIAMLAIALALAGCSEKREADKPATTGTTSSTGGPVRLERTLPAAFAGLPSETGGRCAVDIVNKPLTAEAVTIRRGEGFSVFGWALDEKNGVVPPLAVLQLAGGASSYFAPLARRSDRDDLATALGKPAFKDAGVGAVVDIAALPVGRYDVLIVQKGDRASLACPVKLNVTLVD